jgi:hypothetical protein
MGQQLDGEFANMGVDNPDSDRTWCKATFIEARLGIEQVSDPATGKTDAG